MKAEELRIGNYAQHEGVFYIVKEIKQKTVIAQAFDLDKYPFGFGSEWEQHTAGSTGIPLTEEWLIKFVPNKRINQFEIRVNYDSTCTVYAWNGGTSIFICHLKYVHNLQNFLQLTGEELKIKEG
jgi:hypothetical protein